MIDRPAASNDPNLRPKRSDHVYNSVYPKSHAVNLDLYTRVCVCVVDWTKWRTKYPTESGQKRGLFDAA